MKSNQITTSATLSFERPPDASVPLQWLERACEMFAEYGLSPIFFTANGATFTYDDCYILSERDNVVRFGEIVQARRSELIDAISKKEINSLGLDSTRPGADDRENWRAMIDISSYGEIYVGVDAELVPNPTALLRHAYDMANGLFEVRYGIAYKMPLAEHPDCYASGFVPKTYAQTVDWIHHRREWDAREKTPDELWSEELRGKRRHLTGVFRGTYAANILSEAHVGSAALRSRGIGKLTELDDSLWLWELSDLELPVAQSILESRGVLVSQIAK